MVIKKIFFSPLSKRIDKIFPFKYRLLCFFLPLVSFFGFVACDAAKFYGTTPFLLIKQRTVGMGRTIKYGIVRNDTEEIKKLLPKARKDLEKIIGISRTKIYEIGGEVRKINGKLDFCIIPNILEEYGRHITKLYNGEHDMLTLQKLLMGIEMVEHHDPKNRNYLNVSRGQLKWIKSRMIEKKYVSKDTCKSIAINYIYNVTKSYYLRGFEIKDMKGKFIGYFHAQSGGASEDDIIASKFSPEFIISDSKEKIKVYYLHREKEKIEKINPIYEFEYKKY